MFKEAALEALELIDKNEAGVPFLEVTPALLLVAFGCAASDHPELDDNLMQLGMHGKVVETLAKAVNDLLNGIPVTQVQEQV